MRQAFKIFKRVHVAFRHPVGGSVIIGQQTLRLAHPLGDRFIHRVPRLKLRLLRHVRQLQGGFAPHVARIRRIDPRNYFKQAGFTGAIAPDQANTLTRLNDERSAVQQGPVAIGQFESIKSQQGHGSAVQTFRGGIIRD